MRFPALLAMLALSAGCASIRPDFRAVPRGIEDDDRMIEVIRTLIPEGTPVAEARKLIERQGFKCEPRENASFVTQKDRDRFWFLDKDKPEEPAGLDFLYCCRDEGAGFMVSRRWQVALVHRDGGIIGVLVDAVYTGP